MTFYLKPPRGSVNLHTFVECVEQRLNCYDNICKSGNEIEIHNFNCLVEDSALDRTGHYLFRLYAYFSTTFRQVFLENEQKLLLLRLSSYCKGDIKYFLKRLLKHASECLNDNTVHTTIKEIYVFLISLTSYMINPDFLNHIAKKVHEDPECEKFTLKVPFYLCASLLFHREVNLNKGYAEIYCWDWKKLFLSLYETYLTRAINEMRYSYNVELAANDSRIKSIFKIIHNHWFKYKVGADNVTKFDISNIETESKLFPLCMLNLFKVLQKTNRLPHNERFDFSLFLKGIGVPLIDSIKFWENAYNRQHSSCSKCSHNWKDNEKRYVYGIRHLYGLEGSRKNYTVRSCNHFQEQTLCATQYGGCPFKHFDDNNLRQVLRKLIPNKDEDIEVMVHRRKENPNESCKLFYVNIFSIINNNSIPTNTVHDINFYNPMEYYLSLKKHSSTNDSDSGIVI